jgi:hypothetical protein
MGIEEHQQTLRAVGFKTRVGGFDGNYQGYEILEFIHPAGKIEGQTGYKDGALISMKVFTKFGGKGFDVWVAGRADAGAMFGELVNAAEVGELGLFGEGRIPHLVGLLEVV